MKRKERKGFSLIELVVAIAILGILAAVFIPSLTTTRSSAKERSDKASIETLETEVRAGTASTQIYKDAKTIAEESSDNKITLTYVINQNNILVLNECSVNTEETTVTDADDSELGTRLADYKIKITEYINSSMDPIELQSESYQTHNHIITIAFPDTDYKVVAESDMVYVGYVDYFDRPNGNNGLNSDTNTGESGDICTLFFNPNGGTCEESSRKVTVGNTYGTLPTPIRSGYTFVGWFTATTDGNSVDASTEMTSGNKTVYAQWEANGNTKYQVLHWQQNIGGDASLQNSANYTLKDTDVLTGKTGTSVFPETKNYAGFTSPDIQTVSITADGKATVNYYYVRNKYKVNVTCDIEGSVQTTKLPILATMRVNSETLVKNSNSISVYGYYGSDYELQVVAQGGYVLSEVVTVTPSDNSSYSGNVVNGIISDNTTICIGLSRSGYSIAYYGLDDADTPLPANPSKYDTTSSTITLINPTREGYVFVGWTGSNGTKPETTVKIATGSTGDKEFTANWVESDDTPYTVKHWVQNLTGDASKHTAANYTVKTVESLVGTTNSFITPDTNTYTGFTAPEKQTATISADGSLVVNYYYTRNEYTVTLIAGEGIESVSGEGTYLYEQKVTINATLENGYVWYRWTGSQESTQAEYKFMMPAENVENTANAKAGAFSIIYNLNGGDVAGNPTSYTKYSEDITLINPTRNGYIFGGWTGSNGETPEMTVTISTGSTGDKTFTATWRIDENQDGIPDDSQKEVIFKVVNGTWEDGTTEPIRVLIGLTDKNGEWDKYGSGTLTVPTGMIPNSGYLEGSWEPVPATTVNGTGTEVYIYTFELLSYTIVFDGNGSTDGAMAAVVKTAGVTITLPTNQFTRNGYNFKGWSLDQEGSQIFGDRSILTGELSDTHHARVVLYAIWSPIAYTIKYNLNGGVVAQANPTSYTPDTETFTLNNPTKTGYTFNGWASDEETTGKIIVTISTGSYGNKTYTALWKANTNTEYTVKHWLQTENGIDTSHDAENYELKETEVLVGTTEDVVTPAVKYYDGFKAPETESIVIAADGSTEVNYYYTRNQYVVTLIKDNGIEELFGAGSYQFDTTVTITANIKEHYIWNKWTGTSEQTEISYSFKMPTHNVQYKATTTPEDYTIFYEYNGGQNVDNPTTYNIESDDITLKNPTRTGYTFIGWTGSNGNDPQTTVTLPKGTAGNKSFVANWECIEYKIEYESNGGIVEGENPDTYTIESATIELIAPTKDGYTFNGWTGTDLEEASLYVYIATGSIGDRKYTANWTANEYTLYTVNHWTQNLDGDASSHDENNYTLKSSEEFFGITNEEVNPNTCTFTGFAAPEIQTITIKGDGSAVVNYYYTRNSYTLTITTYNGIDSLSVPKGLYDDVIDEDETLEYQTITRTYWYGTTITLNATVKTGYTWNGWDGTLTCDATSFTFTMPSYDVCLIAMPIASTDTPYVINHYQINKLGNYPNTPTETKELQGTTNMELIFSDWNEYYTGFHLDYGMDGDVKADSATIAGDGSTVVNLYYNRNTYTIVYDGNGSTSGSTANSTHTYGISKALTANGYSKSGYLFSGWCLDADGNGTICGNRASVVNMTTENLGVVTLYAQWEEAVGVFDANDNLIASWNSLVNDYGFDITQSYSMYTVLNDNSEFESATKVIIPDSVTSIGESAFAECWQLNTIIIPDSVTSIGASAFSYTSLTDINIPESVTEISDNMFYSCMSLTKITIPSGVTSIGDNAFSYCTSLTGLDMPKSIRTIGERAFNFCRSLTSIYIRFNTTSIGDYAFFQCSNLSEVHFANEMSGIVPTLGYQCFYKEFGETTKFYFQDQTTYDALIAGTHYNASYGTKSTNFDWSLFDS